jgi:hypothetical protein
MVSVDARGRSGSVIHIKYCNTVYKTWPRFRAATPEEVAAKPVCSQCLAPGPRGF